MTTLRVEGPLLGSICWTDDCGTGSDPMGCVCRLLVPGDDSSFTFPLTERPRKGGSCASVCSVFLGSTSITETTLGPKETSARPVKQDIRNDPPHCALISCSSVSPSGGQFHVN